MSCSLQLVRAKGFNLIVSEQKGLTGKQMNAWCSNVFSMQRSWEEYWPVTDSKDECFACSEHYRLIFHTVLRRFSFFFLNRISSMSVYEFQIMAVRSIPCGWSLRTSKVMRDSGWSVSQAQFLNVCLRSTFAKRCLPKCFVHIQGCGKHVLPVMYLAIKEEIVRCEGDYKLSCCL